MWGKDDGSYDSLTRWDETPDLKKERPKSPIKKEAKEPKRKKEESEKEEENKKEKGQCYYPFPHVCFKNNTMFFMIESLLFYHFHILVEIFHYRSLYIPMMGFLKMP